MEDRRSSRQFQQRVTDRVDRSEIQRAALQVRGRRLGKLKKRYATLMLGATLAIGGAGIPLKMLNGVQSDAAASIAGGAAAAVSGVAGGVAEAADTVALLPQQAVDVAVSLPSAAHARTKAATEKAREDFFRTEVPFGDLIYREAKANDLQPEFVAAVVQTESHFKPNAVSQVGAQGLMQLVPKTGRWMGARNLMNPAENVKAGAKYLKYLTERFDGNQEKALAAYNAGEGNVRRFKGIPPFAETQHYVQQVQDTQQDFHEQITGRIADLAVNAQAR